MKNHHDNNHFWAVTSYYNPNNYLKRKENYDTFRERINLPLLTVEIAKKGQFQLTETDADILIKVVSNDVIWQKERALNLGVSKLPPDCNVVALLDCDIVFEDLNWAQKALKCLQDYKIIQPFSSAIDLARDQQLPEKNMRKYEKTRQSFSKVFSGAPHKALETLRRKSGQKLKYSLCAGFAWVASRELIKNYCLYDAGIVGGGTRALVCGILGEFRAVIDPWGMNTAQESHYLKWANPFFQKVGGQLGCVDGRVYHLWHGEIANRGYGKRHEGLKSISFDPYQDIAVNKEGVWCWNSCKTALHEYLENYFFSRKEDG